MAKKKAKVAASSAQIVTILDSLQTRVSDVADRGIQNGNNINGLTTRVEAAEGVLSQRIKTVSDENARLRTVISSGLESLKVSSQRAFDGVATDVKAAHQCAQRHNQRISALEGAEAKRAAAEAAAQATYQTTSQLEVELKALLTRFGYKVSSVGVTKTDIVSLVGWSNNGAKQPTESLEIKIGASK